MKKHNLGRTLVELLIVSVVALMLGLSMFGYKPVHSNAGTMPAGTLIPSPILLNPVCIGTGCSSGGSGNLSTSGTPATGQVAQFADATHVQGASTPTITGTPNLYSIPYVSTATGNGVWSYFTPATGGALQVNSSAGVPSDFAGSTCSLPSIPTGINGAGIAQCSSTTPPLSTALTGGMASATSIAGTAYIFTATTASGASGATGTITFTSASTYGWACDIQDLTTPVVSIIQTTYTTTTAVFEPVTAGVAANFSTITSNKLLFTCWPF